MLIEFIKSNDHKLRYHVSKRVKVTQDVNIVKWYIDIYRLTFLPQEITSDDYNENWRSCYIKNLLILPWNINFSRWFTQIFATAESSFKLLKSSTHAPTKSSGFCKFSCFLFSPFTLPLSLFLFSWKTRLSSSTLGWGCVRWLCECDEKSVGTVVEKSFCEKWHCTR